MTDVDNLLARLDDKHKWLTIPTHDVIEMVSEAAAVIRALRAGREWRPIDSAPVDCEGPPFIVCDNRLQGGFFQVVYYELSGEPDLVTADGIFFPGSGWCLVTEEGCTYHTGAFTHWQPLPEGPAS